MQAIDRPISNLELNNNVIGSHRHPVVYIRNKTIYIDPVPVSNITGGIKIWGETRVTDLSSSTDEPVFETSFHKILAYMTAITWCASNDKMSKMGQLEQKRIELFNDMIEFYSTRDATEQPVLRAPRPRMR